MKIDNRFLLPFAGPFVVLGLIRAVWWMAGAPWTEPELGAYLALTFGALGGGAAAAVLFQQGIEIGHIKIGGKQ